MKELTCITCPVGCTLKAQLQQDGTVMISGNRCPRGAEYGRKEITNPTRVVTSTVRVAGHKDMVVSVKTASDIPKGKVMECMKELAAVEVTPPIHVGDVVLENIADTGVSIVATRSISE
ncbi:MAG: DUF1667 domain-containing protein [Lachnospiraceae bacterium]|nr:DUF1667 domain-containing protein [Lachnospiraceae bacterium]